MQHSPLRRSELDPMLVDARQDIPVADALRLGDSQPSQVVDRDSQKIFTGNLMPQIPWLNRKVMVDATGQPVAIGVPQQARPKESVSRHSERSDDRLGSPRLLWQSEPPEAHPTDYSIVRVFYATDRQKSFKSDCYAGRRCPQGQLKYGTCDISIPRDHRIAKLESPKWSRFQFSWNPSKHVQILECRELRSDPFYEALTLQVGSSELSDCFVFIHGFNVSFTDGVRRTAQMAYDLGFKGAPILYSWPSAGRVKGYLADETSIEWTRPHLELFLNDLASRSHADAIHIIAHSMGNRALVKLLEMLQIAGRQLPQLKQIVLTAPDIDAGEFVQLAARFRGYGERLTLYASSNDLAIQFSKKIHTYARAGEAGNDIVIVPGVDTIDASAVDTSFMGHSYYAERRTLLSDLFYVINAGIPPNDRHGLEARSCARGPFWAFRA